MRLIIDVKVQNLQRAVDFYSNQLGLVLRTQEKEWAAFSVGDAEIHLYLYGGITKDMEFYVDDIESEVKKFKENGITFNDGLSKPNAISSENDIVTFPWGRTAFFPDSEGNELAIVQDFTEIK